MIGFSTLGERFESTLLNESGWPFQARVQTIEDSKIYPDDFFPIRQIMRIRPNVPVSAGMVVTASNSRRFLLGTLDGAFSANQLVFTSFQMFPCDRQVQWKRETAIRDPLTQVDRSSGMTLLGEIWVLMETLVREVKSADIRTKEETKRVITGSAVELGDVIDGMVVKKLNLARGVRVLEVA